jgi:hypothetical protein
MRSQQRLTIAKRAVTWPIQLRRLNDLQNGWLARHSSLFKGALSSRSQVARKEES